VILVRQKAEKYAAILEPVFRAQGIALRNEAAKLGAQMLQELLTEPLSELLVLILRLATVGRARSAWSDALQALSSMRGIVSENERGHRQLAVDLDTFARQFSRTFPTPPQTAEAVHAVIQSIVGFLRRDVLIAATPAYAQGDWLSEVEHSVALHLQASTAGTTDWSAALDAYEGTYALPLMTLHKSKGLEYHTVIFVGLDDSAWWSFQQDTAESTAGFFVAFTRAKQRVIFTYTAERGTRTTVAPLYTLLQSAGVQTVSIA